MEQANQHPELDVVIERLENLKTDNKKEHLSILEQVTKTNGTVADIQKWRYMITGGLLMSNLIIIPVLVALILRTF